jgi:hypothetical protein
VLSYGNSWVGMNIAGRAELSYIVNVFRDPLAMGKHYMIFIFCYRVSPIFGGKMAFFLKLNVCIQFLYQKVVF